MGEARGPRKLPQFGDECLGVSVTGRKRSRTSSATGLGLLCLQGTDGSCRFLGSRGPGGCLGGDGVGWRARVTAISLRALFLVNGIVVWTTLEQESTPRDFVQASGC